MSAGIILDDSAPTSVTTQKGPTSAAAQLASSCPAMAETVKVNSLSINWNTDFLQ